jgi:hypothetical protein
MQLGWRVWALTGWSNVVLKGHSDNATHTPCSTPGVHKDETCALLPIKRPTLLLQGGGLGGECARTDAPPRPKTHQHTCTRATLPAPSLLLPPRPPLQRPTTVPL